MRNDLVIWRIMNFFYWKYSNIFMFCLNLDLQFSQQANKLFSTCLTLSLIVVIQFICPPWHHDQTPQSLVSQCSFSCLRCCSHQSPSQSSYHYSYLNNNCLPTFHCSLPGLKHVPTLPFPSFVSKVSQLHLEITFPVSTPTLLWTYHSLVI